MYATPDDLDYNMHLSNSCVVARWRASGPHQPPAPRPSSYVKNCDFARYYHFVRLIGSVRKALQVKVANGGVWASFRKAVPPLARYSIRTRLVGHDDKWLFVRHQVILHGQVHSTLLVRTVFKHASGKTFPPAEVLQWLGYGAAVQSLEGSGIPDAWSALEAVS